MRLRQHLFINTHWTDQASDPSFDTSKCQLVLVFGSPLIIVQPDVYDYLKNIYTSADIVFSSTSGEIIGETVYDNSVIATAIQFERSAVRAIATNIKDHQNSFDTGAYLMDRLEKRELAGVFVISDGTFINGSELIAGFNSQKPDNVPVTGGLAGDADRFSATFTSLNAAPAQGNVIAVGFYGPLLKINHGSSGGWDEFGPERTITRSNKNVLYEIDGRNALDLYKEYLGDYADELPGSALLFPISLHTGVSGNNLVRTILNVNEDDRSMTFAGNLPQNSKVRLMKANFDKLITASSVAAANATTVVNFMPTQLAILVSCVGRKLVLNERIDEELAAARQVFGDGAVMAGFYSYGELSPLKDGNNCELHNQTMTITTLTEL